MSENECLESFPVLTIVIGNIITISSVVLGTAVIYFLDFVFSMVYVGLYVLLIILSVRFRCSYCYYCGKRCPSGMGKLVKRKYQSVYNKEFNNSINYGIVGIFSFAMIMLPIVVGIISLIVSYELIRIAILIFYGIVAFVPNMFLKGDRCKKCKQGVLGCPATRKGQEKKKKIEFQMDEDLE
ncbi:MAG: hypothetical protein ACFFCS_09435 [Candidatus Hodarchaeota archaeon]